jgi:hypothetical protein
LILVARMLLAFGANRAPLRENYGQDYALRSNCANARGLL